jgi:glycosyltransferase involved in cell wall biosynthesis
MMANKTHVLVVARWPLGGIRTYMKYTYGNLPGERYKITLIAPECGENNALIDDAASIGASLVVVNDKKGLGKLIFEIFKFILRNDVHLIQSHGFISGLLVVVANFFFKIPHVMTIHGIFEDHLLEAGLKGKIQKKVLNHVVNSVTCLYGVSKDILDHTLEVFQVKQSIQKAVIHNGIDITIFRPQQIVKSSIRQQLGISSKVFLVGFVGRFMPQKGLNYLIEAVSLLAKDHNLSSSDIHVLCVGSGDHLRRYKNSIADQNLSDFFSFIPFQSNIRDIYCNVDIVAMPSVWEAFGLQAAEAMCLGTPIIVSDCIGLREATHDTPAIIIPKQNPQALADALFEAKLHSPKQKFISFSQRARERYDVRHTARKLDELFQDISKKIPG